MLLKLTVRREAVADSTDTKNPGLSLVDAMLIIWHMMG